jgi:hypothetical protein
LFIVTDMSSGNGIFWNSILFTLSLFPCTINTLRASRNFSTNMTVVHFSDCYFTNSRSFEFLCQNLRVAPLWHLHSEWENVHKNSGVGTFLAIFPPFNLWINTKKIKWSLWHAVHMPLESVMSCIQASVKSSQTGSRVKAVWLRRFYRILSPRKF